MEPPEGISLKQRFPHCCRPRSWNIDATLWPCGVSVASAGDAQSLLTIQLFKHVINVRLMHENDSSKSSERMLTQTAPGTLQSSVERLLWWSVGLHWSHFTARHIDAKRCLLCLHEMSRDGTKHLYVMQWKWDWTPTGEWGRSWMRWRCWCSLVVVAEASWPSLTYQHSQKWLFQTAHGGNQDTLKHFKPFFFCFVLFCDTNLCSLSEHRHDTQTLQQYVHHK